MITARLRRAFYAEHWLCNRKPALVAYKRQPVAGAAKCRRRQWTGNVYGVSSPHLTIRFERALWAPQVENEFCSLRVARRKPVVALRWLFEVQFLYNKVQNRRSTHLAVWDCRAMFDVGWSKWKSNTFHSIALRCPRLLLGNFKKLKLVLFKK